jgi:hypothetical protein
VTIATSAPLSSTRARIAGAATLSHEALAAAPAIVAIDRRNASVSQ